MKKRNKNPKPSQKETKQAPATGTPTQRPVQDNEGAADSTANVLIQEAIQRASLSDHPATEDELGFKPYVDAIAAFLVDERTRPPLTLSIEGEWGAGKSSFMRQLEAVLHSKYGKKTVRFNAWRHDKDEALWASFAIEFVRQIAPRRGLTRIWRRLRLFWRRLNLMEGLPNIIRAAAGIPLLFILTYLIVRWIFSRDQVPPWLRWLTDASSALQAVLITLTGLLSSVPLIKKLIGFIGNPFQINLKQFVEAPNYQGRLPFLEQFHQDFKAVVDVYVGPEADKIFIFVDDLDRCEVPKAAELMQALNLMIPENSKLIFILGMDRDMVAAGIAHRHANILPLMAPNSHETATQGKVDPFQALSFGYSFLERFIQIPFRIPKMGGDSLSAFCDSLMQDPILLAEKKRNRSSEVFSDFDFSVFELGQPQKQTTLLIETSDADSPAIREAVALVAPALGSNPRRLKQFINAFRLNAFLFSELGHFDVVPGTDATARLNLAKLAKIVAVELWWPKLLDDAEEEPGLIQHLEARLRATNTPEGPAEHPFVRHWSSQASLMQLLSTGLEPATEIGGLDVRKMRRLSPKAKRTGIATNWQRRFTAPWKPSSRFLPSLLLQTWTNSQEGEAKANLKALFTTERAYYQEKDRYDSNFETIGYKPESRQLPLPSNKWIAGSRFIYTVEIHGNEFYGYALGVDGKMKDVEYEIRSDGDWEGRPRRIAPATVDSETYKRLGSTREKLYFTLRYPSTFKNITSRGLHVPQDTLIPQTIVGDDAQGETPLDTSGETPDFPILPWREPSEHRLLAIDRSAQLTIRSHPGSEWTKLYEAASQPSQESGRVVLERIKKRGFFSVSGYVSGLAFNHLAIRKRGVIVELELLCNLQTKTGYARVMNKIMDSIEVARLGHWSSLFITRWH